LSHSVHRAGVAAAEAAWFQDSSRSPDTLRRRGECLRVRQFPAKIQPADEREHLAEAGGSGAQPHRKFELGAVAQDHAGALTPCIRGR
jgi:hypothetical protein